MVICLERDADLQMAPLMPLPLTVSCFSKTQIGFAFLVPAHPGSPRQRAVKRACVRVCYLIYYFPFCYRGYIICGEMKIFKRALGVVWRGVARLICAGTQASDRSSATGCSAASASLAPTSCSDTSARIPARRDSSARYVYSCSFCLTHTHTPV